MMSVRSALPVALLALGGCVPELTSPDRGVEGWNCPTNSWECAEPSSDLTGRDVGFFEGQTLPRGRLFDQNGDEVDMWQFYGKVIVLDISTMWCSPCRELACYTEDTWQTYKDDGVVYLTVIPQNAHGEPPEADDLQQWVEQYDITAPVIGDPDAVWSREATLNGQFPVVIVADSELTVIERVEITADISAVDHTMRAAVERELGIGAKDHEPVSVCD